MRLKARGECLLQMSQHGLKLALRSTGVILAEWPLKCLRRYSCDNGQFQFEAGRKAPLGEGIYGFLTNEEEDMFDVLDYLVKSTAGQLVTMPMALSQRMSTGFPNHQAQYDHLIHQLPGEPHEAPRLPPPPVPGGAEYSVLSLQGRSRNTSPGDDRNSESSGHTHPAEVEYNSLRHTAASPTGRGHVLAPAGHALPEAQPVEYNSLQRGPSPMPPNGVAGGDTYDTLSHRPSASPDPSGDMYNTLQHVHPQRNPNHGQFASPAAPSDADYQQLSADAEKLTINVNYGQPLRYSKRRVRD